jgi:hypothetical protein
MRFTLCASVTTVLKVLLKECTVQNPLPRKVSNLFPRTQATRADQESVSQAGIPLTSIPQNETIFSTQ